LVNLEESLKIEAIKVLCLFLFCFLAFAVVFVRPTLFGFDSYASVLCVRGACDMLSFQPLAVGLFGLLIENLFLFKFLMFVCFFLSVWALWKIVTVYFDERVAWLSIFGLLALSPLMLFSFGNFENEVFAYPLLFWGFYCLIQANKLGKLLFFLLVGVSIGFWGGGAYFLLALLPFYLILMPISIVLLILLNELFVGFLIPTTILESRLFAGYFDLFLLILTIPFIFGIKNKKLWLSLALILIFTGLQGKFNILLIPFLILGLGFIILKFQINAYQLMLICTFLIIGWQISFWFQQPTTQDFELVNQAKDVKSQTGFKVYNDWSNGYWLNYVEIDTNFRGGGSNPDYNNLTKPFIALTQTELDCNKINSYHSAFRELNLYKCT
jgi:hypothetical protein